jgi:thymidylate kinase
VGAAQLILIEGMIGAGKSTTATRVGDWLARRGEDVRVFAESAPDHPIRTRAEDRLRTEAGDGEPAGHPSAYEAGQWRRLAECCLPGGQTVILEGSYLQNSVMPAFIDGAGIAAVTDVFTRIQDQVAPAEPLLVYLRPADVRAAIARTHAIRGEPWSSRNLAFVRDSRWARQRGLAGQEAVVGLYEAWEPVVTQLYGQYPFPKIMVTDPQDDWPGSLARICAAAAETEQIHGR